MNIQKLLAFISTLFFYVWIPRLWIRLWEGWASVGGPLTMDPELRKENSYSLIGLVPSWVSVAVFSSPSGHSLPTALLIFSRFCRVQVKFSGR
jgi:hypothetical protein